MVLMSVYSGGIMLEIALRGVVSCILSGYYALTYHGITRKGHLISKNY